MTNQATQTISNVCAADYKAFHKFLLSEALISYGIFNGLINALIFYLTEPKDLLISTRSMAVNLTITMVLLSIILSFCVYPLTKMKWKKGAVPKITYVKQQHFILSKYPSNRVAQILITAVLTTILCSLLVNGWESYFNINCFTVAQGTVFKGITCTVCGAMTGYFSVLNALFALEAQ